MEKVKEALKMSINAMKGLYGGWRCNSAIKACENALAELEQALINTFLAFAKQEPTPRQPLTDQEICDIAQPFLKRLGSHREYDHGIQESYLEYFAREIEKAHGIGKE